MRYIQIAVYLFVFSTLIIFIPGCRDTCNENMGETFTDIKWDNITYAAGLDQYITGFNITVIEALPVDYLRTASQEQNENAAIDSIAFPDINQMNLYILKDAIPAKNSNNTLQFKIKMDDRRDYTNCVHPGSPDRYEISMSFRINNTDDILTIDNISWDETVIKKAI